MEGDFMTVRTSLTQEEKESLAEENMGLVHHIIHKFSNLRYSYDDKLSAALYGMAKALNTFNPSKGIHLATYMTKIITNEILLLNQKESKHLNNTSLDTAIAENSDGSVLTLLDIIAHPEKEINWAEINHSVSIILKMKNDRDKKIFALFVEGKTQKEIGNDCNLSQAHIARIIAKLLKEIKKEFWRGELI